MVLSWLVTGIGLRFGSYWAALVLLSGFVFIAPVLAIGLYSISRQLGRGQAPSLSRCVAESRKALGTALVFVIALGFTRWIGAKSRWQLLGIGALWVALTIAFEVGLGRAVLNFDWTRILADYDLSHGGLLGLGLLAMLFMPLLAARIRGRRK